MASYTSEIPTNSANEIVDNDEPETEVSNFELFKNNITVLAQTVINENLSVVDVIVQISAEKFAADRTWLDCAQIFVPALLMYNVELYGNISTAKLAEEVLNAIVKYRDLLSIFCNNNSCTDDDKIELIFIIQDVCEQTASDPLKFIFHVILHRLYMEDVIDRISINRWHEGVGHEQDIDDITKDLLDRCSDFIQWLNEEDEEDDVID